MYRLFLKICQFWFASSSPRERKEPSVTYLALGQPLAVESDEHDQLPIAQPIQCISADTFENQTTWFQLDRNAKLEDSGQQSTRSTRSIKGGLGIRPRRVSRALEAA